MEKQTVESEHLRLRQKVVELRSNLADRRQTYERKRKVSLGIKVVTLVLAAVTVGYYLTVTATLRDQPALPAGTETQDLSAARTRMRLTVTPPVSTLEPSASTNPANMSTPPLAGISESSQPVKALVPAVKSTKAPVSVEDPAPVVEAAGLQLLADRRLGSVEPPEVPKLDGMAARGLETSAPVRPPREGTRLNQILTCLGVEARQCAGFQSIFTLNQHRNPHVWMDVHSRTVPYVLKHVYYHAGRKYVEVPLAITYPRMRTWSHITLRSPTQVGTWRVEIVTEDGTVLGQVGFDVTR